MFELLSITEGHPLLGLWVEGSTFWGVLFLLIILTGAIFHFIKKHKTPRITENAEPARKDSGSVSSVEPNGANIALCQIFIIDGDRNGNFVRIENAIAEAKSKGAQLICFPEASILGWLNSDAYFRACTIPGPDSQQLCQLAQKYSVYISIGIEELETGRLFNSALLINDQGQILLKHRQINIPQKLMPHPYTPANENDIKIANTKFGKIGLLICADTHRQDILDRMTEFKPNLLLVPYGYAENEQKWPGHAEEFHKVVVKTAKRTSAAVIGVNPIGQISKGPWSQRVYGGQSIAVDRMGNIIDIAADRDRDIKILPLAAIK